MSQIKKIAAALLIAFAGISSIAAHAETKAAPTITPTITSANAEFVYKLPYENRCTMKQNG